MSRDAASLTSFCDEQEGSRKAVMMSTRDRRGMPRPYYFVMASVRQRACVLGEGVDGEMRLNDWGQIVHDCWQALPGHFPHVTVDAFVVMPNHVHGIVVMDPVGDPA